MCNITRIYLLQRDFRHDLCVSVLLVSTDFGEARCACGGSSGLPRFLASPLAVAMPVSLRQAAFACLSLASPLEAARVLGVVDPSGTTSSLNHFWASLRCE